MPIELITENHGDVLRDVISSSQKSILIISPFMGRTTCHELSEYIIKHKIECKIITRFYREDFIQNVSSLDGLLELKQSGAVIYALIGLHTKLYIIDDIFSIITSANYTYGGMYNNFELGVKVEDEQDITKSCRNYFYDLWGKIEVFNTKHNNVAYITEEKIEAEKVLVNKSISSRTKGTVNRNEVKQGAKLEEINHSSDLIEKALEQKYKSTVSAEVGGWLKFEADAQHRHDPEKSYLESINVYTKNKTFFPTRPVGIKMEHKLFLSLVSYDNDGVATPVIVGRGFSKGFNKNNIVSGKVNGWESWMNDYPYFVEFEKLELIHGPAKNGISLLELYRNIKGDIYPSTFQTSIPFEKLRQYHYQKDKIRITKYAEEYIDKIIEERFEKFGKDIIGTNS